MREWIKDQQNLITFVLVDSAGNEVSGLGTTFVLEIDKAASGTFTASAGTKSEIANGWYAYLSTAGEADTFGPVSIKITHASIVQQNLEYVVKQLTISARERTYTVTNSATTNPIDGVRVWVSTDLAGNNVIWTGVTNALGIAKDLSDDLPRFDDGTYYFWKKLSGYTDDQNPDTEVFTAADSTGEGTMTPVTAGVPSGIFNVDPIPYTLLSLPRYAKIMGINPVHFQGAYSDTVWPIKDNACEDVWVRHSWQYADMVSREDLARTILDAENDIARVLGYHPAPRWVSKEMHRYAPFHRVDYTGTSGLNANGRRKSVTTNWKKIIAPGRRAVSLVGTATTTGGSLAYTDEDGDGFAETATITLATSLTDACEIKAYFSGTSGMQEWEIRPAKRKTITGGNVVLVYDSWLFIDPERQAVPTDVDGFKAINIGTIANFVTQVDVYREYTDNSQASAQFFWEPKTVTNTLPFDFCTACSGTGCPACAQTSQDGCIAIRDVDSGVVVPAAGTYDAATSQWTVALFTECVEPHQVKLWYYAGDIDEYYLRGASCDPLSHHMAQTIAYLATARLERSFCACGNAAALADHLRTDIAFSGENSSFLVNFETLTNPFGTRIGELWAWRRVSAMKRRIIDGAVV